MINERFVKIYCKDSLDKIENYEQAINDKENVWELHHRLELTLDGEYAHSYRELKRMGMYYHRPYFELIFIKRIEHRRLHLTGPGMAHTLRKIREEQNGKPLSPETRRKISEANKGRVFTDFGKLFKEHYGLTKHDDKKLWHTEYCWYIRHNNKCRWEV